MTRAGVADRIDPVFEFLLDFGLTLSSKNKYFQNVTLINTLGPLIDTYVAHSNSAWDIVSGKSIKSRQSVGWWPAPVCTEGVKYGATQQNTILAAIVWVFRKLNAVRGNPGVWSFPDRYQKQQDFTNIIYNYSLHIDQTVIPHVKLIDTGRWKWRYVQEEVLGDMERFKLATDTAPIRLRDPELAAMDEEEEEQKIEGGGEEKGEGAAAEGEGDAEGSHQESSSDEGGKKTDTQEAHEPDGDEREEKPVSRQKKPVSVPVSTEEKRPKVTTAATKSSLGK